MTTDSVLVVDDSESGRYLKVRALRSAGFDVTEVATAAAALEHVEKHMTHVAVLDVKLPDMHGFELCRIIKERFPSIGVLQTSATFTSAEDRVAGLEFGADAYLVEPMEETELIAIVRALLRVRLAEAAQHRPSSGLPNLPKLRRMFCGSTTWIRSGSSTSVHPSRS